MEFRKNINKNLIEIIKWFISLFLLIFTIICNYNYQNISLFIRLILFFLVLTLISYIILSTNKGKKLLFFINETRIETHKVIWPTYKYTWQTTLVITIITIIMSIIIWILDNFLIYLISFLTGTRV
ncbi:preprotein translocase subunit SecE [Enterobacteriaceae endosymbiont of Donacia versicolorea]|uniref:preprotein translocase subunit SecE n=1 Tax=Enterobacteriaceae endosymbiont of Donacia versicolorea TaxID=2675788 RepID=UPI001449B011|nr:preprotein translocase subunit SecE [Enterobacteriaceae endosymbiont of Donacia versicolorea]QJC32175.1 preprotein translocase subunit SecE [Enterobacteriaceae endosymbiont of Donacia versicolorea]